MDNTAKHSAATATTLALCAFLLTAPPATLAQTNDSPWTWSIVNGTATVESGPTEGDLAIPDTLGGCPVTAIAFGAFQNCTRVTSATLPASLAEIGPNAFQGCSSLAEFRVSADSPHFAVQDGVLFSKDLKTLVLFPPGKAGPYAIPEGVETVADFAFASDAVTSLSIPGTVQSLGNFSLCLARVSDLTVPESVVSVGAGVFLWCSGLKTLRLPSSWQSTTLLEDSGGVASGCTVLYYKTAAEKRYDAWLASLGRSADELPMDADADSDGASNWDECVASTDPFDPADRLRALIRLENGLPSVTPDAPKSNRVYRVFGATALPSPDAPAPAWQDLSDDPDWPRKPWHYFRIAADFAD